MINILLAALIFHTLLMYVFKLKSTSLNCGLFGGSFNRPLDDIIREKLKILGFFNMSRGKDSCGYYNGDIIVKGVDKQKEFYSLMVERGIDKNINGNNVFIGHTRQSTYGVNNATNAHPFNINNKLVLAHNGTISNIWDMCNKNGVSHINIHVDSLALGEIIVKNGNFKALEEYKGGAALLMHRVKEPGTLYVYHGGSYNYNTDAFVEERPLFWLETEEGVYLSSLKDALNFIRNQGDPEPIEVPHNEIWKINKGVKYKKPSFIIDRSIGDISKFVYTPATSHYPVQQQTRQIPIFPNPDKRFVTKPNFESVGLEIEDESEPSHVVGNIYYSRGRYKESFVLLADGVMHLDSKLGKKLLADELKHAKYKTVYFVRGVMIKTQKCWDKILNAKNKKEGDLYKALINDPNINFAKEISMYSKYPVTNRSAEAMRLTDKERKTWFLKGKPVVIESVTPFLSNRDYHYKDGALIKIVSKDKAIIYSTSMKSTEEVDVKDVPKLESNEDYYDKDVVIAALRFKRVYNDISDMQDGLGAYCLDALELYAEDVLTELLDESYSGAAVSVIRSELMNTAILKKIPLYDLFDTSLNNKIEDYLTDVMSLEWFDAQKLEDAENDDDPVNDYAIENPDIDSPFITNEQALEILKRKNDEDRLKNKAIFDNGIEDAEYEVCHPPIKKPDVIAFEGYDSLNDDDDISEKRESANLLTIELEDEEAVSNANKIEKLLKEMESLTDCFSQLTYSDLAQNISRKLENATEELRYNLSQEYRSEYKYTEARLISGKK